MGRIIKKHLIHSSQGEAGRLDIYLYVENDRIYYENATRDYYAALIFESSSAQKHVLSGSVGSLILCGKYIQLRSSYTIEYGENVLEGMPISAIKQSEFGDKIPFELNFPITCPELGLTQPLSINASLENYPLYTAPQISAPSEVRLGEPILLGGQFLDVGYDVTATVTVAGQTVSEQAVDLGTKSLNTELSWITPYPTARSIVAIIVFSASFAGDALPNTLSVPIKLTLNAEDARPKATVICELTSGTPAVAALKDVAVKGRSAAIIRALDISGMYGAYVKHVLITVGNQAYIGDYFESDVFDVAGVTNYSVKVTDSRGIEADFYGSINVYDYLPPCFDAEVTRVNSEGQEDKRGAFVSVFANLLSYSAFNGANMCSFHYTLRRLGEAEGEEMPLEEGSRAIIDAELESGVSYELKIICRDLFDGFSSKVFLLEKENIELNIAKNKVGIGKYAEKERILDCAWPISCVGDVTIVSETGEEKSVLGMGSSVTVHDVGSAQEFEALTAPPINSLKVILMNISNNTLGYSNGYHAFLVFNNKGTVGRFELKTV